MPKVTVAIAVAMTIVVSSTSAVARSTGWVTGYEWLRIWKSLEKNGELPVSVVCRDSAKKGLSNASGLAKVEIQPNPRKIAWSWAFGGKVQQAKKRYEARGYKLVSYSEYRRASGLKIACAIWHKK